MPDNNNRTPLFIAVDHSNIEMVQLLLENGAKESVNIYDINNETPLSLAVSTDNIDLVEVNIDIVQLLLQYGGSSKINSFYNGDKRLLDIAIEKNNIIIIDIIVLLIKWGADKDLIKLSYQNIDEPELIYAINNTKPYQIELDPSEYKQYSSFSKAEQIEVLLKLRLIDPNLNIIPNELLFLIFSNLD